MPFNQQLSGVAGCFVYFFALFAFYIFWAGCEKMLNPPDYKKMPMLIATFVSIAVFYIAGIMVLGQIFDRLYFSVFA
jgi:Co/Zn/Cd efflux system component